MKHIIKNENKLKLHKSGYLKDNPDGKLRYDLIPHELLTRLAMVYTKGLDKYPEGNWKKASRAESLSMKAAAWRHFVQWANELNKEEDHGMQAVWNIFSFIWINEYNNKN